VTATDLPPGALPDADVAPTGPTGPTGPADLASLRAALPEWARDLRLNLATVTGSADDGDGPLTLQQVWGAVLACAIAARSAPVLRALEPEARARLAPEAYTAAKSAAAVMTMNNVFYRTRHLLSDPEYGSLRAGLRMNVLANPGVPRADFELWAVAVSALNGCGACLDAHERTLRAAGADREAVQEAFKIAAVVQAVATVLDAEAALGAGPG
jgi:alkyl hydroperoxide reductase subunit D